MLVPLLRCRRCNEEKHLSEFDRSYFGKNGYDVYCHNCRIEIDNIQNSITEKTCRQCGRAKPISEFGKNASIRDGYNKECLDCQDDNHRRRRDRKYKDKWDGKLSICRICGQQKPTYEFIKRRYSNVGYVYCRSCISELTRNKVLRFEQEREEKGWPLEKTCKECGRLLPSDHFHLDRRQKDGLAVKCRNCYNQNEKQRIKKLKEKHRLNKLNKNSRKECSICHNLKPISNFSKNESTLDGLSEICKVCIKKVREENIKYWKEERAKKDEKIKTKQCKNCGRILPIDMFSKNRERKKGYYNICKDCTRVERIAAEKRWEAERKKKSFEFSFDVITEKKCRLCGKILPVSEFYRRRSSKDG
ncbi:hypothetical protein GF374_00980, partial [Candidatus Woesearchaeota archaeon]|nr:hypothetical protein [Candidatus Woesearchaeota archaeon]